MCVIAAMLFRRIGMRKIEVDHVTLGNKTYPAYCDLRVLEQLQDEYETITKYERALLGQKIVYDADGNPERADDGTIVKETTEQSVHAIVKGLYLMIREGQRIEGETDLITEDDIYEMQINVILLKMVVHGLFMKCFDVKKKDSDVTSRKTKKQN